MRAYKTSSSASASLFENIKSLPEFQGKVIFHPNTMDNICGPDYVCNFSIEFIRTDGCIHGVYGMSIAHRPLFDRILEIGVSQPIEITLLGKIPTGSNIYDAPYLYDKTYGYANVCSFYKGGSDEVVCEINRILSLLSCDSFISYEPVPTDNRVGDESVPTDNRVGDESDPADSEISEELELSNNYIPYEV